MAAQGDDLGDCLRRGWAVELGRPGGAVLETGFALGHETGDPFADSLEADAEGLGDSVAGLALDKHPAHQFGSTARRQTGILMDVHPVPLQRA
ncbi:hypothetical protein D3C83_93120 [compost metagenome]